MNRWTQAKQLFGLNRRPQSQAVGKAAGRSRQAATPRPGSKAKGGDHAGDQERPQLAKKRARSVCIISGKGGTGKSSVSASLAALFGRRGPTLLLDADLGCANAHILQDVHPTHSFADVIAGDVGVEDIVTPCGNGVDLLAGGSGFARLAGLQSYELEMIGRGLEQIEPGYEYLVVDSAAGLSRQTVAFAAACDVTVLVTTPDVTAMTDAYAFLKVFVRQCAAQGIDRPMPLIVVNRATDDIEAGHVAQRLQDVVTKFLGLHIEFLGFLPDDRAAFRAMQKRSTVVASEPNSELARALTTLSCSVLARLARVRTPGAGQRLANSVDPKHFHRAH